MFFESAATPRSEKAAKDILGVSGDLTSNIGDVERVMSDLKMKYTVANKEMDNKEQTIRATKKMLDDEYKAAAVADQLNMTILKSQRIAEIGAVVQDVKRTRMAVVKMLEPLAGQIKEDRELYVKALKEQGKAGDMTKAQITAGIKNLQMESRMKLQTVDKMVTQMGRTYSKVSKLIRQVPPLFAKEAS